MGDLMMVPVEAGAGEGRHFGLLLHLDLEISLFDGDFAHVALGDHVEQIFDQLEIHVVTSLK